jgi:hypothetical protein
LLRAAKEINLQTLTDDKFAALCHAVLFEEHGIGYKPVAGEGGDSGIDGFVNDYEVVYQFKFFKARPRPSSFLKDIDKVAHILNLKSWVLLIPEDPTQRLYQMIAKEKATRSFNVETWGKTWILAKLNKYRHIKERFFPEIAKEESVQKVIHLNEFRAGKHEELLKEIKREVRSRKPIRISAERPLDSLTPEHIRLIKDEIKRVEKTSDGKESFGKICSNLKNKYGVDNWYWIDNKYFPEIMDWLRKYYYATRGECKAPGKIRIELIGVIKAQQKRLKLNDKKYRELLFQITGKTSSTHMEIHELKHVRDYFNMLLGTQR